MRASLPSIACALLLLGTASSSAAQTAGALEAYRAVALEGQDAFNRGDYAEARRIWRRAEQLSPNPRIYRLLGRVAHLLDDPVEAVRMLRLALSAPDRGNPLTDAQRAEIEGELLPRSLAQVGELVLALEPADATVHVDGRIAELEGGALLLAAGSHALRVERAGYATVERRVTVAARSREPLEIVLEREAAPSALADPTTAPPSEAPSPASLASPGPDLLGPALVLGVAGAGVVLYVAGLFSALAEMSNIDAGACGGPSCTDAELADLRTFAGLADAGWVTAAVAAAVGFTWLGIALSESPPSPTALRITPWALPDSAGLVLAGTTEVFQ